jgi:hypothetical protein
VAQVLLKQAATRFNLRLANSGADLQAGSDITKTILAEIQAADVVIVLVAEGASANVWYGMGAAAAYDRPVIVVLLSPQAEPPPAIRPTVVVGPVLSIKAIELALERALRRQKDPVADGASRQGDRTGAPLGSKADMLLAALTEVDSPTAASPGDAPAASGAQFEHWFASLLDAAEVPFDRGAVADATLPRAFQRIDFVVTVDELERNLGSPLAIELLAGRSISRVLPSRLAAYSAYLAATGATTLLVVALRGVDAPQLIPVPGGALVACNPQDLVKQMQNRTFGEAVLSLRNAAAHEGAAW